MGYTAADSVYIGCAANKIEQAYEIGCTGAVKRAASPLRRIAQRFALIYEALVVGEIASYGVELPNPNNSPILGARFGSGEDHAFLVADDFQVSFSERDGTEFVEDRLQVGLKGDQREMRRWLGRVETEYLPKGKNLPKMFWPVQPNPEWETLSLSNPQHIVDFEQAAVGNSVFPWGYRTKIDGDSLVRTYYFRDTSDAVLAKLMT